MNTDSTCEICYKITPLVGHHIQSISFGGNNKPYNRCRICPNCHSMVHYGKIIIEGRFETTAGNVVIHRKKGDESITGFPEPKVWLYSDKNIKTQRV